MCGGVTAGLLWQKRERDNQAAVSAADKLV